MANKKRKIINTLGYDITISYSWFREGGHGICGHTFEVIDYYMILNKVFNCCIMICDPSITPEIFKKAITSKYTVTKNELADILQHTIFPDDPTLVVGNIAIFTDGGVTHLNKKELVFKKIFLLACGDTGIYGCDKTKYTILADKRVYPKLDCIDYKKKILFDRMKLIGDSTEQDLLYITTNCRNVTDGLLDKITTKTMCVSNVNRKHSNVLLEFVVAPVEDIFSKFNRYIYTPIQRKFDCSPRFIAECKYYNKEVVYEIDYIESDLGLYWRKFDIENDFNSLHLNLNDGIILLIKKAQNEFK